MSGRDEEARLRRAVAAGAGIEVIARLADVVRAKAMAPSRDVLPMPAGGLMRIVKCRVREVERIGDGWTASFDILDDLSEPPFTGDEPRFLSETSGKPFTGSVFFHRAGAASSLAEEALRAAFPQENLENPDFVGRHDLWLPRLAGTSLQALVTHHETDAPHGLRAIEFAPPGFAQAATLRLAPAPCSFSEPTGDRAGSFFLQCGKALTQRGVSEGVARCWPHFRDHQIDAMARLQAEIDRGSEIIGNTGRAIEAYSRVMRSVGGIIDDPHPGGRHGDQ